eukprot:TRINITY_DN902_c0_g1_i1.p1 TRINITY_DN902_c0_g1~~TRINITY_DN902_c0_g1_i1.p1  ORF type:complete len:823 (-),score=38.07 TRINITY_DN902_c0_g1_i1:4514-6982(-)
MYYNGEWLFELDSRYFAGKSITQPEPPNYYRYWETVNHRAFSTVESKAFPLPEYTKIMQYLEWKDNKQACLPEDTVSMICEEKILPLTTSVIEPNIEFNGTSEANATNETSDGVELNKDLDPAELPIKLCPVKAGPVEMAIPDDDSLACEVKSEPIVEITDTKVKLRIGNILPQPQKSVRVTRPKKTKKPKSKYESPLKEDSSLLISPLRRHPGRPSGIQNIGNTCYLSSSIQCLRHTEALVSYLEGDEFERSINTASSGEVIKALRKLLRGLSNEGMCVSPYQFKKTIDKHTGQFPLNKQCDAHEFLTFLIDKLHDETLTTDGTVSPIDQTFYGRFRSTIQCIECHKALVIQEPFMCISLPVDGAVDELNMLLHTKSQHLFCLSCKFDDEGISIGTLKSEIKRQLIVSDLDIYILVEGQYVELVSDTLQIGQVLTLDKPWELYAIEREASPDLTLLKLDAGKTNPALLLSYPKELLEDPHELRVALKRLVAGPLASKAELNTAQYNFTLSNQTVYKTPSGLSYVGMELRPSSRNSHFIDLTTKLPHREIEILLHKTVGEDYATLEGCLKNFTDTERLHGNNQWSCETCQKFTDAHKKLDYLQLPKVLVIHLKRFKVRCKKNRVKISKLIKFPTMLPLQKADQAAETYRLYGVINHVGDIERGHYTAYCREQSSQTEWMQFDDNKVTALDPTQLETANAYVLFYEQTSIQLSHNSQFIHRLLLLIIQYKGCMLIMCLTMHSTIAQFCFQKVIIVKFMTVSPLWQIHRRHFRSSYGLTQTSLVLVIVVYVGNALHLQLGVVLVIAGRALEWGFLLKVVHQSRS